MKKLLLLIVVALLATTHCLEEMQTTLAASKENDCKPRQVRLLIGEDYANYNITEIRNSATIIFQTYGDCTDSYISVTLPNSEATIYNSAQYSELVHSKWNGEKFCHHNKMCTNMYYDQYVHIFRLPLPFEVSFSYTVYGKSSSNNESRGPFHSQLPSIEPLSEEKLSQNPQRILFFGDQDTTVDGQLNMKRWRELKNKGKKNPKEKIDSMMFLGDYAYEFYMFNGQRGDNYLQALEEFSAEWPIALQAGNHEDNFNFKFYNEKFRMPSYNETNNNYFSYNQGLAHFIGLNFHFFDTWATPQEKEQMIQWVEQDLIKATQNRKQTPWIIVFGHKPIYCSGDSDCKNYPRTFQAFDQLFYKYSVDLFLGAHVHRYQFLKPMFANSIQNFEGDEFNIVNPQGMVSIVQGNGGHILEFLEDLKYDLQFLGKTDERAFEIQNYVGYGILEIYNSTTLCLQNVRALLNKVESIRCIHSEHYFNPENLQTANYGSIISTNASFYLFIVLASITAVIAAFFAYKFLFKNISQ